MGVGSVKQSRLDYLAEGTVVLGLSQILSLVDGHLFHNWIEIYSWTLTNPVGRQPHWSATNHFRWHSPCYKIKGNYFKSHCMCNLISVKHCEMAKDTTGVWMWMHDNRYRTKIARRKTALWLPQIIRSRLALLHCPPPESSVHRWVSRINHCCWNLCPLKFIVSKLGL